MAKIIKVAEVRLPETFKKVDIATCENYKVVNRLKEIGITQTVVDALGIGYTEWNDPVNEFRSCIIIPSHGNDGNLDSFLAVGYLKTNTEPSLCTK